MRGWMGFCAVGGALAIVTMAGPTPGYLPTIGPGTIRLQSAPDPPIVKPIFPVLSAAAKPVGATPGAAAVSNVTNSLGPAPGAIAALTPTVTPTNGSSAANVSSGSSMPGGVATGIPVEGTEGNANQVVTPQMLVPFFMKSSSNRTTTLIAPVGVLPSSPNLVPSSSATYFSPPEPDRNRAYP
jgi:hypothetical protein